MPLKRTRDEMEEGTQLIDGERPAKRRSIFNQVMAAVRTLFVTPFSGLLAYLTQGAHALSQLYPQWRLRVETRNFIEAGHPGQALLNAASMRHTETVGALTAEFAPNVNAVGGNGDTPLHIAAEDGNTETAQILIVELGEASRLKEARDFMGENTPDSALIDAAKQGRVEIVRTLIREFGANVNALDEDANTPLHLAAIDGHTETVRILITEFGANVNAVNSLGSTALHWAALDRHTETVRILITEFGANVNALDKDRRTPLHLATLYGHSETVRALITLGANVNALDGEGDTPLHLAYTCIRTETAGILIAGGANVNAVDREGNTPLHLAALFGQTETARILITEFGANVNAASSGGYTPLHQAAKNGHTETAGILIAGGANVNPVALRGNTPIVLAFEQGHHDTVRLLEQHGAVLPAHLRAEQAAGPGAAMNGNQSTHNVSVHISVSESARALKGHYSQSDLAAARAELSAFLSQKLSDVSDADATRQGAAKRSLARLLSLDFIDQRSGVRAQDMLAYIWLGLTDPKEKTRKSGDLLTDKTKEEYESDLLKTLVNGFYEIQRAYNLSANGQVDDSREDRPSCASGSFNSLVNILNGRHSLVHIRFVTPEVITLAATSALDSWFSSLDEQTQRNIAARWTTDSGIPESDVGSAKISVGRALERFNDHRAEVTGFDGVIQGIMTGLEYQGPTPAVLRLQESMKQEVSTRAPGALVFSSSSAATATATVASSSSAENPESGEPSKRRKVG